MLNLICCLGANILKEICDLKNNEGKNKEVESGEEPELCIRTKRVS